MPSGSTLEQFEHAEFGFAGEAKACSPGTSLANSTLLMWKNDIFEALRGEAFAPLPDEFTL
jgi:hypothetical protein